MPSFLLLKWSALPWGGRAVKHFLLTGALVVTLGASGARAADNEQINAAIDRGVTALSGWFLYRPRRVEQ
jgi:hypothetical protein